MDSDSLLSVGSNKDRSRLKSKWPKPQDLYLHESRSHGYKLQ